MDRGGEGGAPPGYLLLRLRTVLGVIVRCPNSSTIACWPSLSFTVVAERCHTPLDVSQLCAGSYPSRSPPFAIRTSCSTCNNREHASQVSPAIRRLIFPSCLGLWAPLALGQGARRRSSL